MKILNLFAGIGGNRKGFQLAADSLSIDLPPRQSPADQSIADEYSTHFPQDTVIVDDAWEYIVKNYRDFDFIWASPPCQSHSRTNNFLHYQGNERLPDFRLYSLIAFLTKFGYEQKWVVENVIPYYPVSPLYKPTVEIDRHYFWANFTIQPLKVQREGNWTGSHNDRTRRKMKELAKNGIPLANQDLADLEEYIGIRILNEKLRKKRQILRNCVLPVVSEHIFSHVITEQVTIDSFFKEVIP